MTIESRSYFLGVVSVPFTRREETPGTIIRGVSSTRGEGIMEIDTPDLVWLAPNKNPADLRKFRKDTINKSKLCGPVKYGIQRRYSWRKNK